MMMEWLDWSSDHSWRMDCGNWWDWFKVVAGEVVHFPTLVFVCESLRCRLRFFVMPSWVLMGGGAESASLSSAVEGCLGAGGTPARELLIFSLGCPPRYPTRRK